MARWILSFGIDSARAFCTARRRRGFMAGSGAPILAATVISRASFENIFDLAASWRPFRCMMFLNCEWPAMTLPRAFLDVSEFCGLIVKQAGCVQKEE